MMKKRVLIVSNRLPVNVTEEAGQWQLQRSNGGLATALISVLDQYDARWIGWAGNKQHISRREFWRMKLDRRLRPVTLSESVLEGYYDRMSNGTLWPMLHGLERTMEYKSSDWEAYVAANQKFATALIRECRSDDIIWIQDYHLMLLPQMLRKAGITNRIGFFLHTPFRTGDQLAELEHGTDILQSLSEVDVLGFQTTKDVEHFNARLKEAGFSMREGSIVQSFPIGADYEAYHAAHTKRLVRQKIAEIATDISKKQIILSISRLDYTKGILEQLQAYEGMLNDCGDTCDKYLYKVIVAPSREDAAGYKELKVKIDKLVSRINKNHPGAIDYTYRNCGFEEVNAWYCLADILLVTPRIDGMNLVVKEFIAAHPGDDAVVIMSETIGAAQQLKQAILVDPTDVTAIQRAIEQAVAMSPEERKQRYDSLLANVRDEDVFWWVRQYLRALESKSAKVLQSEKKSMKSRIWDKRKLLNSSKSVRISL